MGSSTNPFKDQQQQSHTPNIITKKLLFWSLYALLLITLVPFYFYPFPLSVSTVDRLPQGNPILIPTSSSPPQKEEEKTKVVINKCDYTKGKWVSDKIGPLYNGTNCNTIKDGQNCISHGRPDFSFLFWKWFPYQCNLPRFDPNIFFRIMKNKHLAFVGDSMARNQLESLICMLSSVSPPLLVFAAPSDGAESKFRRWHFPSHNLNVSIYWSPFLVKGVEKSEWGGDYNKLYLDKVDERWANDLDLIDMVVLSIGHWFLHPAVYMYGDTVLGCHSCSGENYTEIGFYDVFGKAFRTTLRNIIEKRGSSERGIDVMVTTFSPHHFEGEWDKFGACPKTQPYSEGERDLGEMDLEMRKVEIQEVEASKIEAEKRSGLRLEALDVTRIAFMRPDGHPGPYMYANPFANGIGERVQNDCVHWCLPGPIDTWNEIMLDVMKRWEGLS